MRIHVLRHVAATTFREHMRKPEALFWTYAFPLILMTVLGLAFGERRAEMVAVAIPESEMAASLAEAVRDPRIEVAVLSAAESRRRLAAGEVDAVMTGTPQAPSLRLDPARQSSERAQFIIDDALERAAGRDDRVDIAIEEVDTPGERYLDWLIPGLLGMQLLGAGLWGIGFNLVDMRSKGLLRRLAVTPLRQSEFLLAFMLSRLALMFVEAGVVIVIGVALFGMPFNGSLACAALLVLIGGLTFSGLGVLVASRVRTLEAVSGLMNMVLLPMWLLGGIFFSAKRFPDVVQPVVQALPITHMNEGMRAVILRGEGIDSVWPEMLILLGFATGFFLLASKWFRWS